MVGRLRLKSVRGMGQIDKATARTAKRKGGRLKKPLLGMGAGEWFSVEGCLFAARLPMRLTNGNTGRTTSWHLSARNRCAAEAALKAWGLVRSPVVGKVSILLRRVLAKGEKEWDAGSWHRGNWKEIQDALVACGWFEDDGPRFIAEPVVFEQAKRLVRPEFGVIEIEVRKVPT